MEAGKRLAMRRSYGGHRGASKVRIEAETGNLLFSHAEKMPRLNVFKCGIEGGCVLESWADRFAAPKLHQGPRAGKLARRCKQPENVASRVQKSFCWCFRWYFSDRHINYPAFMRVTAAVGVPRDGPSYCFTQSHKDSKPAFFIGERVFSCLTLTQAVGSHLAIFLTSRTPKSFFFAGVSN